MNIWTANSEFGREAREGLQTELNNYAQSFKPINDYEISAQDVEQLVIILEMARHAIAGINDIHERDPHMILHLEQLTVAELRDLSRQHGLPETYHADTMRENLHAAMTRETRQNASEGR
jgi:hypothetical protein